MSLVKPNLWNGPSEQQNLWNGPGEQQPDQLQCQHLGAGLGGEHREDASATAHIQHILVAEEVGVIDDCVPAFMLSRSTVCKRANEVV